MKSNTFWQHLVAAVGAVLLATVIGGTSHEIFVHPEGFVFTPRVCLGNPTPGGDTFVSFAVV